MGGAEAWRRNALFGYLGGVETDDDGLSWRGKSVAVIVCSEDGVDELVAKAVDGDRDALGALVKICGRPVHEGLRVPKRYRSAISEDDIMQKTYEYVLRHIGNFREANGESFYFWLKVIAKHKLCDAIKELESKKRPSPRKRVEPATENGSLILLEVLVVTTSGPSGKVVRDEIKAAIEEAVKQLPSHYAQVVTLKYLVGLSGSEIGARMERTPTAVFMLLARALPRLRRIMGSDSRFRT